MIKRKLKIISAFIFQSASALVLFPGMLSAAEEVQGGAGNVGADWGYIAAALAVGLACIGSGYAVAKIGSASIGAVTEKPEIMGKTLVFLGLAEGIAIYGLIIAVMILNKL